MTAVVLKDCSGAQELRLVLKAVGELLKNGELTQNCGELLKSCDWSAQNCSELTQELQ
jgi:hypothetical protein